MKTRILIVDDHELLCDGLRVMIASEPDLKVCGQAGDEATAITQVRGTHPHLVIVDIALKSGNGIGLIKRITAHFPEVRTIVVSMHDEQLYGERALQAGALGYVNKQEPAHTILVAIRRVLQGHVHFSDDLTQRLMRRCAGRVPSSSGVPFDLLSNRELEIFTLIGQGLTTDQIAHQLHLSPSTIGTYRERLRSKLSVTHCTELSRLAIQWVLEQLG